MKRNDKKYIGQDTRRRDLLTPEREHDPYKSAAKPAGDVQCPSCQAVFLRGRWTWSRTPPSPDVARHLCPACTRIADECPAGLIRIEGDFAKQHRQEILNLLHNCQAQEARTHPLSRIIKIDVGDEVLEITTTDLHLPRMVGNALERAYKRQAEFNYDREGYFVRVHWRRDND